MSSPPSGMRSPHTSWQDNVDMAGRHYQSAEKHSVNDYRSKSNDYRSKSSKPDKSEQQMSAIIAFIFNQHMHYNFVVIYTPTYVSTTY